MDASGRAALKDGAQSFSLAKNVVVPTAHAQCLPLLAVGVVSHIASDF